MPVAAVGGPVAEDSSPLLQPSGSPSQSPFDLEKVEPAGGVSYGLQNTNAITELKERTGLDEDYLVHQMMLGSCAFFASEVLQGPAEYGGRFMVAEHHEEWSELVNNHDRLCIEAPRGHGKSHFFSFAYAIWRAWKGPRQKGYIFSATQPQAERILDEIKNELESNPRLMHLVPKIKVKWSNTAIRLANGHTIFARGYGTKVRGGHPHWIIVDDGLNDETSFSETTRKREIEYFFAAISNMPEPRGGQLIVVGTPFHQADLYGKLEHNPEYEFRRYQAFNEKGEALWPERFSLALLEAKKREIGSIRFTREYQCLPMADDMSLFPKALFAGKVERFDLTLGMPGEFWDKVGITTRYMAIDFAISANVEADFTVIWVMGVDVHGNRWIVDIIREKGLPYEAQKNLIIKTALRYEPALIYTEANQFQRIFGDDLIRETDLPIKQYQTGEEKHSLEKGIPSLRILFENIKMRIPRGDARTNEIIDIWISEMHNNTFQDGKVVSIGEHDDMVMAFWLCNQACRSGAFAFSFGEEDGDAEALEEYETETEDALGSVEDYEALNEKGIILRPEQLKRGGKHSNLVEPEDPRKDRWKPKDGAPPAISIF